MLAIWKSEDPYKGHLASKKVENVNNLAARRHEAAWRLRPVEAYDRPGMPTQRPPTRPNPA